MFCLCLDLGKQTHQAVPDIPPMQSHFLLFGQSWVEVQMADVKQEVFQ